MESLRPEPDRLPAGWLEVPSVAEHENGFKLQWVAFHRHVAAGGHFPWDFSAGVRRLKLVYAAMKSWRRSRWVDLDEVRD